MTLQPRRGVARLSTINDGKPTQINEHKRTAETRVNEHEPHAMARQRNSRPEGRAQ